MPEVSCPLCHEKRWVQPYNLRNMMTLQCKPCTLRVLNKNRKVKFAAREVAKQAADKPVD
jgi:hypothetical protein